MGDRDDVFNRRIEQLEYRLSQVERFGNVITSTQRLTTFTSTGGVGAMLGKLPTVNTFAGSSYGLLLRSSTGGLVRGDTLAFGLRAAYVNANIHVTSLTLTTVAGGPSVTVRVGPSRRALITFGAFMKASSQQQANMCFKTTGASFIASSVAGSTLPLCSLAGPNVTNGQNKANCAVQFVVQTVNGLSSGSNTFTAVYQSLFAAGADFSGRFLTVQPF